MSIRGSVGWFGVDVGEVEYLVEEEEIEVQRVVVLVLVVVLVVLAKDKTSVCTSTMRLKNDVFTVALYY